MFTIMGITGNVGGAIAENLLASGNSVRGVVRNPEKAKFWADRGVELFQSEYNDPERLAEAFRGSKGIFTMIPPNFAPEPDLAEQKQTIEAIRSAIEQANPAKAVSSPPLVPNSRAGLDSSRRRIFSKPQRRP